MNAISNTQVYVAILFLQIWPIVRLFNFSYRIPSTFSQSEV